MNVLGKYYMNIFRPNSAIIKKKRKNYLKLIENV